MNVLFAGPPFLDDATARLCDDPLNSPWWDPTEESRLDARRRILAWVDWRLDQIEEAARAAGAVPPPVKRTGDDHFRWLARYHVKGESFAAIARDVNRTRQTIAGAIHDTAALIGLSLHEPDPPGPQRKPPGRPRIVRIDPSSP